MYDVDIVREDADDMTIMVSSFALAIDEEVLGGRMARSQQKRIMQRTAAIGADFLQGKEYIGSVTSATALFIKDLNQED